jgi:hypothetical protein
MNIWTESVYYIIMIYRLGTKEGFMKGIGKTARTFVKNL